MQWLHDVPAVQWLMLGKFLQFSSLPPKAEIAMVGQNKSVLVPLSRTPCRTYHSSESHPDS